jgi:serine/threonine protein kinase
LGKSVRFGKYELLDRIEVGGFAEVHRARLRGYDGFERLVAIKRVLPHIADDRTFVEMFIEEAKLAVRLRHPNIAQILELGQTEGTYFIAMEYVHGKDLRAIWRRQREISRPLPIPIVVFILLKVCDALHYAHCATDDQGKPLNIIHRDVSPQNVLVSFSGEVKVIDFGLAKAAGRASRTQVGVVKGKLAYLAPEQARGKPLDRRTDVYASGICLWEMLTRERLFSRTSDVETVKAIQAGDVQRPRDVDPSIPKDLEKIVLKSLAKDPAKRFQSAQELADALEQFLRRSRQAVSLRSLQGYMRESFPDDVDLVLPDAEGTAPFELRRRRSSAGPPPITSRPPPLPSPPPSAPASTPPPLPARRPASTPPLATQRPGSAMPPPLPRRRRPRAAPDSDETTVRREAVTRGDDDSPTEPGEPPIRRRRRRRR